MSIAAETVEQLTLEQEFLKKIRELVSSEYDEYWKSKHNQKDVPEGISKLRKLMQESTVTLKQVSELASEQRAEFAAEDNGKHCLFPLFDLIVRASYKGLTTIHSKDLVTMRRKIRGERVSVKHENSKDHHRRMSSQVPMQAINAIDELSKIQTKKQKEDDFKANREKKERELALFKDKKNKDEALANYELGMLLIENDPAAHANEAYHYLTRTIELSSNSDFREIKAYALRARSILFDYSPVKEKHKNTKSKDLEDACVILESIKEVKEEEQIKEHAITYLMYGEELIRLGKHELAKPYVGKSLALHPTTDAIKFLYQAHDNAKKYKNVMDFILDMYFDAKCLPALDSYLRSIGSSLWLEAAQHGKVVLLEKTAEMSGIKRFARDKEGNNALHCAAAAGHLDLIPVLKKCLKLSDKNDSGLTPVMVAAKNARVLMVQHLLFEEEVDYTTDVIDIFSVVIASQQEEMFNILSENKHFHEYLETAGKLYCKLDNNEKIMDGALLIKAAIAKLYQVAIDVKSTSMLRILIKRLPDGLNILRDGESPLHSAVRAKFEKGVHLLIESGCNFSLTNSKNHTALELAKEIDSELESCLENAQKRAKKKQEQAEVNYKKFVDQVLAEVCGELSENKKNLKNEDNKKRLKEQLDLVFNKSIRYSLFEEKAYDTTTSLLLPCLVRSILTKVVRKKEITKTAGIKGLIYDRLKLLKVLQEVLSSSWRTPAPVSTLELKMTSEGRTLSQTADVFCRRFEKQIDKAYCHFVGIVDGQIPAADEADKVLEATKKVSAIGSTAVTVAASGAVDLIQYFRGNYRKKKAERMIRLFAVVTPYERAHFVRYTAEQLAIKYHHQIHHLSSSSDGVEKFADCAAARVVQYITSSDENQVAYEPSLFGEAIRVMQSWIMNQEIPTKLRKQKDLYDTFLDGIIKIASRFPEDVATLTTINNLTQQDKWQSKAIFENTGICTQNGDRYAHPDAEIELYGYCFGTVEEAMKRGLTLKKSAKELWGKGRFWEQPTGSYGLIPLPGQNVPGRPSVTVQGLQGSAPENLSPGRSSGFGLSAYDAQTQQAASLAERATVSPRTREESTEERKGSWEGKADNKSNAKKS